MSCSSYQLQELPRRPKFVGVSRFNMPTFTESPLERLQQQQAQQQQAQQQQAQQQQAQQHNQRQEQQRPRGIQPPLEWKPVKVEEPQQQEPQQQQRRQEQEQQGSGPVNLDPSPLLSSSPSTSLVPQLDEKALIRSQCQCGRLQMTVPIQAILPLEQVESNYNAAVDCHCPSCRKYHVVGFCSYLLARQEDVTIHETEKGVLRTYRDSCMQLGPVVRMQCNVCKSKLATRPLQIEARHGHQLLLNLGPIDDETLPPPLAEYLQENRQAWQYDQRPVWPTALSASRRRRGRRNHEEIVDARIVTGSCSCGQCRYRIRWHGTAELQHCYCRLCRRVSGGPFQTWVPFDRRDFQWLNVADALDGTDASTTTTTIRSRGEPRLQRYVPFGQRHVCDNCGGVLTILYDQSQEVWPAAGTLDDSSLPGNGDMGEFSRHLHHVMHISCRYKQSWYDIPQDGNPRIPEAG